MATNTNTLCLSCLSDKGFASSCRHCGFDESHSKNSPVALPLRTVLNERFLIGRILGQPGGFGITYLAWDIILETPVAIKEFMPTATVSRIPGTSTVQPNTGQDQAFFSKGLTIFLNEAKTLAQFAHANIVRIKDFFKANNTAYLIMDYHQGMALDQYIKEQGGHLTQQQALAIMLPILDGLELVHQHNFLHRDIKPKNIYITDKGIPLLLDFGAARLSMLDANNTLTVMLSRGFAPFEQYHQKGLQGPWSDIYACGATLYYMVTGKTPADAIERRHHDQLVSPINYNQSLKLPFNQAILKALAINASDRPQSVGQFKRDLMASVELEKTIVENTAQASNQTAHQAGQKLPVALNKSQQELRPTKNTTTYRKQEQAESISLGKWAVIAVCTLALLSIGLKRLKSPGATEATPSSSTVEAATVNDAEENHNTAMPAEEGSPQPETSQTEAASPFPEPQFESTITNEQPAPKQPTPSKVEIVQEPPKPATKTKPTTTAKIKNHPSNGEPLPVPVSAIEDCKQKTAESECSFDGRNGREPGICLLVLPDMLSCVPKDAPRPPSFNGR